MRGKDDLFCSVAGAVFGGIAAASSVADMPSSVATFVAFTYVLNFFDTSRGNTGGGAAGGGGGSGDKIEWRGRSMADIKAEAEAKARANYEKRHAGDATRLKALR